MAAPEAYEFGATDMSDAGLTALSAMLRTTFPHAQHLTPRYLRWQYRENPDGRAIAGTAWLDGKIVGHSAALPLCASIGGEKHRGLLMVNTAVSPQHFRRNIGRRITDPMFEAAGAAGYRFVMAVGNSFSTRPMLTRFKLVGPLEARVGVGPLRRRADRPAAFQRLWSEDALRWRLANPETTYRRRGKGDVATVTAPTKVPGLGAVMGEALSLDAPAPGSEYGPLKLWIGLDPGVMWGSSSYVPIPLRLRPSPLNLVFKDLQDGSLHPEREDILFRCLDFDAF